MKLVRDYRSTPQVVGLANGLLGQARGQAAAHRLELVSQREAGPEPVYTEYPDEPAEAEGAARRIKELIGSGVRPSEIAVLYRINAQSEVYEQALADAGVPYQLRGAERFFERPEVREAGLLLRGAARAATDPCGRGRRSRSRCGRCSARAAGRRSRRPARARCATAGSRWRRWCGWRRTSRRPGRRRDLGGLRRRARRAGERAARPDRRGRHPGVAARGQGPGVGRGLPGRPDRGHAADHVRQDRRAGRGGAPAAVRRGHPGPAAPGAVLGAVALAGRPGRPAPLALPRRAAAGLGAQGSARRRRRAARSGAARRPPAAAGAARCCAGCAGARCRRRARSS